MKLGSYIECRHGRFRNFRFPLSAFRFSASAFTLIELMVVVGIMGLMLMIGVPIVYKVWHREPMTQAIAGVVEVCSNARARAILQGHEVDVMFHPREGKLEVSGSGGGGPGPAGGGVVSIVPSASSGSGLSTQLSDSIRIEDLDINLVPGGFRDADNARVRFFPNGTCDEMRLFLVSDKNERCEIKLEVTTALASVEHNALKFR